MSKDIIVGGTLSQYKKDFSNFAVSKQYSSQDEYPYHNEEPKP